MALGFQWQCRWKKALGSRRGNTLRGILQSSITPRQYGAYQSADNTSATKLIQRPYDIAVWGVEVPLWGMA